MITSRTSLIAAALSSLGLAHPAAAAGDATNGEKVCRKCMACHSAEPGKNKVGPSLFGVVGRTSGTVEGFKYSDAMKNAGIVWGEDTLDEYLADPRGVVPKTRMAFPGLKDAQDREDVIAYLESLHS